MLSAPGDLDEGALASALQRGWAIGLAAMAYRAVGWGSHHWEVAGADGTRWFVTVDELEQKRLTTSESADEGFARLTASLSSAAADGWRLIDWDTVLVAPPERDLWSLDPGDGSILDAYAAAVGVTPVPGLLEPYRLGWDVKDMAVDAARLLGPHAGTADDDKTWKLLSSMIRRYGR
jgi:hypothetical protein